MTVNRFLYGALALTGVVRFALGDAHRTFPNPTAGLTMRAETLVSVIPPTEPGSGFPPDPHPDLPPGHATSTETAPPSGRSRDTATSPGFGRGREV